MPNSNFESSVNKATSLVKIKKNQIPVVIEHEHRRPKVKDFKGKTIKNFKADADNIWRFWFTDGSAFAIQSELHSGVTIMELCEVCVSGE